MKRQLLIRTGQLDRALAEAREMAEAIPYEAENHVILADLYGAAKQDSLAIAEYNRALEIDSMNVPALASLAEFYNKRNDSHAYLAVSKRLFEIDELPLSEKVRIFRQLTLDVRFYRDNFFQLNDLISTLAIRYPDDKDVVELYAQHLINAGELEQALTLYKLHLADRPPQLDYYRAVIDIETYRKRLDSVYLYIDRALEVFPGNTELYARKGHAQGYTGKLSQSIGSYKKPSNMLMRTPCAEPCGDISATLITRWRRPDGRTRNGTNTAAGVSRLTTVRCIITTITRWCSITTPIL